MLNLAELSKKIREETPKLKTKAQLEAEERVRIASEEQKKIERDERERQYQEKQRIHEEQKPVRVAKNIKALDEFIRKAALTGKLRHELPRQGNIFEYDEGIDKAFLERHGYQVNVSERSDMDGYTNYRSVDLIITKDSVPYQNAIITSNEAYALGVEARVNLNQELRSEILLILDSKSYERKEEETFVKRIYRGPHTDFRPEHTWGEKSGHVFEEVQKEIATLIPGAQLFSEQKNYLHHLILIVPKESAE